MRLVREGSIDNRLFRGACTSCSSVYEDHDNVSSNVIHRVCGCGKKFPLYEQKESSGGFFTEFFKQFNL